LQLPALRDKRENMGRLFDAEDAAALYTGGNTEAALLLIANRYMEANPQNEYTARLFLTEGIKRNKDYRYTADFSEIFPHAPHGSYVYAWGKYPALEGGELKFTLIPRGPVKIWINGESIYGTDAAAERYDNSPVSISLPVKNCMNHLVLRFTRTKAGFGGEFGTWLGKLAYYFFRGMEHPELPGLLIEGFDHTGPLAGALTRVSPETLTPLCLPLRTWTGEEKGKSAFGRIFSEARAGDRVAARTAIISMTPLSCCFSGMQSGNCTFYLEGEPVYSSGPPGFFQFEGDLAEGQSDLLIISECPGEGRPWDFTLEISSGAAIPPDIKNPFESQNSAFPSPNLSWIFAGPFRKTPSQTLSRAFDRELLVGEEGEKTWWRLDMPYAWVRLYNENPLFGHWNYPLGVTLYGLIETARFFEQNGNSAGSAIGSYVKAHVEKSIRTWEYALFDREHFGGATAVHHLLSSIDSLDDCGSFGALVLELAKDRDIGSFAPVVDYTGEHILKKQDRREEGCFWRREMMHRFHNGTLWADDLYMSVPFLSRYAQYKKDPDIMELAALQFEGFKKYLFMEDRNLMAHVFDFNRNMNTGVPWGRGNGWTIFSLTELLIVLPRDHHRRRFLLDFYRTLAAGYLASQDENGMWHQVLDMPSSYIETSCTAMFIAAFCRGLRFGWLADSELSGGQFSGNALLYQNAAEKAWQALECYAIDRHGNVHGVCRGSEFSFSPRYYAEHLLPRLNDTHGIGIVLLAGIELLKLKQYVSACTLPS